MKGRRQSQADRQKRQKFGLRSRKRFRACGPGSLCRPRTSFSQAFGQDFKGSGQNMKTGGRTVLGFAGTEKHGFSF
jgi:hypothetical protein